MSRPLKRARTSGQRVARPIDKELIVVAQTATTSVVATTLKTTTFPGTVVGLRWNFNVAVAQATADAVVSWLIVVVQDGEAANTPSQSNGADLYTPEQNVLAFGVSVVRDSDVGQGPGVIPIEGSTKTMRKLKQGDLLQFITLCSAVNGATAQGAVQFFFKT